MVSDDLLNHLAHKIFIGNPDGKKFLELMKAYHLSMPTFPTDPLKIKRHGGSSGWAAFRAGQLDFLLRIETMANQYEQKIIAESNKDKK